MRLSDKICFLESILDVLSDDVFNGFLMERRKLTPYQKAQKKRRETIAKHTARPAKQSTFYKHAVSAIFKNLKKRGESFKGASVGAQRIAQHMLKKHNYAKGQESGDIRLTSKGRKRNVKHVNEPKSIKDKKERSYNYIMGIQKRRKAKKDAVAARSASAG